MQTEHGFEFEVRVYIAVYRTAASYHIDFTAVCTTQYVRRSS